MSTINLVFWVFLGGLAILYVIANISTNRSQRLKLLFLYLFLFLGFMLFVSTIGRANGLSLYSMLNIPAFGVFWPQLISLLINQQRPIPSIAFSKLNQYNFWMAMIAIMFFIGIAIISITPHTRMLDTNEPVYDEAFFYSSINFLLMIIPTTVYFFALAIQRTIFCTDGIIQNGVYTAWSYFQSYEWASRSERNPYFELTLQLKKAWLIKQVKFQLSPDNKERIENILAQNFHT